MYKLFIPHKKRSWKRLHIRLSYAKYTEVSNLVIVARDHRKISTSVCLVDILQWKPRYESMILYHWDYV